MASSDAEGEELRSRIRQQEAVAELIRRALETDTLDELLRDAVVTVSDTLDVEYCQVIELLSEEDEFVLRQGTGWADGAVGDAVVPTREESRAGYSLLSEEPVIADDLREEDRFSGDRLLVDHEVVSGITVVVGSVESPWGVLGTFTSERREFTENDDNFVRSVANVLASTVDRSMKERRLRNREKQLHLATEAASIGLWSWDVREDLVTGDEFVAETYGKESDVATGGASMETFFEPIHEDDVEETWERLQRALRTGELDAEYRTRDANGELTWLVARGEVEFDAAGEPVRLYGAVTDITERKRRERALEEREKRYRNLFTSMSEGYCVIERMGAPGEPTDFRYVEANSAFEEHTGIENAVGETLRGVVPKDVRKWVDTYESVVRTGEPVSFERGLVARGRVLECYAFPVGDETSELVGVMFTDVSDRVERERRLEELVDELEESNERLEQFAYAASHDLREPLRMVSSYLQLIEQRYADALDEDGEEFLEFAVDGADRMRGMIEGLLRYSRVESRGDPFEPVDLDVVLDDVLSDLRIQIGESDAEITADELPAFTATRDSYGRCSRTCWTTPSCIPATNRRGSTSPPSATGLGGSSRYTTRGSASIRRMATASSRCSSGFTPEANTPARGSGSRSATGSSSATGATSGWSPNSERERRSRSRFRPRATELGSAPPWRAVRPGPGPGGITDRSERSSRVVARATSDREPVRRVSPRRSSGRRQGATVASPYSGIVIRSSPTAQNAARAVARQRPVDGFDRTATPARPTSATWTANSR
nr:PAS domain S-box protein [Halobaculum salinum]